MNTPSPVARRAAGQCICRDRCEANREGTRMRKTFLSAAICAVALTLPAAAAVGTPQPKSTGGGYNDTISPGTIGQTSFNAGLDRKTGLGKGTVHRSVYVDGAKVAEFLGKVDCYIQE